MPKDRFTSYHDLLKVYTRGKDFSVSTRVGANRPDVLIMAPHGGKIEMRTAEIADAAAAEDYSCYMFEAKLPSNNRYEMHIASERYDVPDALDAVKTAKVVIALHGRVDDEDASRIWMGGLDAEVCKSIGDALENAGFPVLYDPPRFKGTHPSNIRNRGTTKAGVQLEIPLSLRQAFKKDAAYEKVLVSTLRSAIAGAHTEPTSLAAKA